MVFLLFTGRHPKTGEFQEFMVGGPSVSTCFELLSVLVKAGCQLISVRLILDADTTSTPLPIDAFDGEPMLEPLQLLKQQWEELLYQT